MLKIITLLVTIVVSAFLIESTYASCHGDENAVSGCSNYCGNRCSDIGKKPGGCPLFCMVDGCACKKGYFYDVEVKKCVLPSECTTSYESTTSPPESCHGDENAVPGCSNYCGNRCSDIGKKPGFCPLFCLKDGCACKEGYFYDVEVKKCVLPSECTTSYESTTTPPASCQGDENAVPGCSNYCGNRCADLRKKPAACPLFCLVDGCACKEGYVYDELVAKKCVLPCQCPIII